MDMGTVAGSVILTLRYSREGENWVGICQGLSTSTFADTLEHCQQELIELVIEHLNVLEEIGQRERFFHDWGIELYPAHISPKEVVLRGDGDPFWDDLLWDDLLKGLLSLAVGSSSSHARSQSTKPKGRRLFSMVRKCNLSRPLLGKSL